MQFQFPVKVSRTYKHSYFYTFAAEYLDNYTKNNKRGVLISSGPEGAVTKNTRKISKRCPRLLGI